MHAADVIAESDTRSKVLHYGNDAWDTNAELYRPINNVTDILSLPNHLDTPATVLHPPNDLHCRQDRVRRPADEQTDCAVYAVDGLDDDISSSITYVTSNPSCTATAADDLTCPMCAVEYMQQGLCLPGRYSAACL